MFERIIRPKPDFSGMPSRLQIYQKSNFVHNFLICNTAAINNSTNFLPSAGMESSTKALKKKMKHTLDIELKFLGVAKFDTTREPDTTRHEISRLWVEA